MRKLPVYWGLLAAALCGDGDGGESPEPGVLEIAGRGWVSLSLMGGCEPRFSLCGAMCFAWLYPSRS